LAQERNRPKRTIAIFVAACLASVGVFDNVTQAMHLTSHELAIRVACGMAATFLLARYGTGLRRTNGNSRSQKNSARILTQHQIYRNALEVWRRYHGEHIQADDNSAPLEDAEWSSPIERFAHLLVNGAHVVRITEDVHVAGDMLRNHVVMEISLAQLGRPPSQQRWVIPVLHRKQHAFNGFEVRNGSDDKLSRLPQHLADGLLAWSIEGMFRLVYVDASERSEVELNHQQKAALFDLIALVCRPEAVDAEAFAKSYKAALGDLPAKVGSDADGLRSFCSYFATNTVSAVEIDADCDDVIFVSYTDNLTNDRLTNANDRHRTRLGIRPYRYRIPIYWAYSAEDYDLRVTGPDGHFVYRHYLMPYGSISDELSTSDVASHPESSLLMRRNDGVPHTGLQLRGMSQAKPANVECVVEFEEIPPGALRRTAVISAVCSLLMIAFTFSMPHTGDGYGGTDLAAFLLASPLFAATWVGQSSDKVQQSSLTTYGGLLISAVLSLVSSVVYVMQSLTWETATTIRLSVFHYLTLPGMDAVWLTLSVLSLATTLYLFVQSTHRMSRYINTLKRRNGSRVVQADPIG